MSTAQKRERIVTRLLEEEMRDSFLDYSMSVIVSRALPDVRDGLKPVHRRILYAMHEMGLRPDRGYKKCAAVVGDVLGKYHPHGDSAVYDTLVRMVQDFSLRYPLIDGQGNFGSIDGDSAAAYRYTEARLASVATPMLDDIGKETVDFVDNFDNRIQEPGVLPGTVPNLLINGSSGIAVGMSTNIPPHNLREVVSALRVLADDPECSIDDLMREIPGPDFPTGGFVVGDEGIHDMYREGRGRVVMRARIVREALRGGKEQLVVTEIPYAVSKGKIIEQIASLARQGKLEDVSDMRDETDREGIRLVIELKRGADTADVLRILYKRTYLQSTFGAIMLALDHGQPREFDLKQMLEAFRDHRLEVIRRRSRYDLEKAEAERHVTEGLIAALDAIETVIRIIRESEDRPAASSRLRDALGLSEVQADAILNMRLGRLTALEQEELRARLEELETTIAGLREILDSEEVQLEVLLGELEKLVAEHGDARRTVILPDADEKLPEVEEAMPDEDVVVTVSHEGYVKRMPMHLYRRRVRSGKALAGMERYEEDYVERMFTARTRGWLLAFTRGGHCHFLQVLDVPESARSSRGQSIYSLLSEADREDRIVTVLPVDDLEEEERVLVFLTAGGIVKRSALSDFSNPRSTGLIAAGLKEGDRILDVALSDGTSEVMLLTRSGRAIRFPETDVSVMGRTAQGVKGIDLRDEDRVVGMLLVRREADVLTVTARGAGKRTPVGDFPLQKRGGLGTLAVPSEEEAPDLVGALEVLEGDEVMVLLTSGRVARVPVSGVPRQGRRTRGPRIVELAADDRVVELTRTAGQSSRPEGNGGGPGGGSDGGGGTGGEDVGEADEDGSGDGSGEGADGAGPVDVEPEAEIPAGVVDAEDEEDQLDLLGDEDSDRSTT